MDEFENAPALKYGKFDCRGKGFTFHSHARPSIVDIVDASAPHFSRYICHPRPGQRISVRERKSTSRFWVEAEVRLYGLTCHDWTVENMRRVLIVGLLKGGGVLKMDDKLARMEKVYDQWYKEENQRFQRRAQEAVEVPAEYVELCGEEKDCFVEEFVNGGREFVTQVMDAEKIYGLVELSVEEE